MNIVLIRHDNSVKDYLFQTPAALHAGNRVLCNTSRGEQYGTAQCDSIEIGTDHDSQTVLDILVRIIGATLPLKNVVGLETKTVERFADKPAEPAKHQYKVGDKAKVIGNIAHHNFPIGEIVRIKSLEEDGSVDLAEYLDGRNWWAISEKELEPYTVPAQPEPAKEPVKLYCVKGKLNWNLKSGEIVTLDAEGHIDIHGKKTSCTYTGKELAESAAVHAGWGCYLVPLVKRPAKVGEWVLITNAHGSYGDYKNGDVLKVRELFYDVGIRIYKADAGHINHDEYLVLDGYTAPVEPKQPEPKYWSGKVVCVETHDDFTVGKVYEFKDGKVTDDDGDMRSMSTYRAESLEAWNKLLGSGIARFIEFKGESK